MKLHLHLTAPLLVILLSSLAVPLARAQGTIGSELDCLIEPYRVVTMAMPVEGLVDKVAVERGGLVRKNQVLVTLESSLAKANVDIARAQSEMQGPIKAGQARLEFSKRKLERNQDLFRKKIVSPDEMDETVTEKELAELDLLRALENRSLAQLELQRASAVLDMRTLRSPIKGVVVERFLHPGEFADQNPVLELAQIDPLRVEVFAPVSLVGKIRVGMQARVTPEQPVGGSYKARVTVVDRVVDAASGTFGVRLELPNPGYKLPAGLKCTLRFLSD